MGGEFEQVEPAGAVADVAGGVAGADVPGAGHDDPLARFAIGSPEVGGHHGSGLLVSGRDHQDDLAGSGLRSLVGLATDQGPGTGAVAEPVQGRQPRREART